MLINSPWIQNEIVYDGKGCKLGDNLPSARKVQEWLILHGFGVSVDGVYGPATQRAVREFQEKNSLPADGVVDSATFDALVAPLQRVLSPLPAAPTFGAMMVAYARQHLTEHPLEVGGQNRGPWVRLYMEGNEGEQWAWCAGFVSFIMRQAADTLQTSLPVTPTFSCDELASRARKGGIFIPGADLTNPPSQLSPGSIFIHRTASAEWSHTGIVVESQPETFVTMEGNTNDEGSREGYEVCKRIRSYGNMDFIAIP